MKTIRVILFFLFVNSYAFSQGTFSQDQIVPDFFRDQIAADSTVGIEKTKLFVLDNSGNLFSQPSLFDDIDLSSYELLSTNLSFKDDKTTQKIVLAPFKLGSQSSSLLSSFKLNLALKNKITTFGLGIGGDNSSPYSKKSVRKLKEIYSGKVKSPDTIPANTSFSEFEKTHLKQYKKTLDSLLIEYNTARQKNILKYTIGYNVQLFPVLFAKGNANDFDSLNDKSIKSHVATISGTYAQNTIDESWSLTCNLNFLRSRSSALEGQEMQSYFGPSFSGKVRVKKFLSEEKLRKNSAFLKSYFIPALFFGVSYEGRYYKGKESGKQFIMDGIESQSAFTFFLDFVVSKSSQFRIGIPITRQKLIDTETITSLGTTIQYNFKISNLN